MQPQKNDQQKVMLEMLNQIFEIEKKLLKIETPHSIGRNINTLKGLFETKLYEAQQVGLFIHNPLGEKYDETRLDCEASIAGESTENLHIVEVIKPIIHQKYEGSTQILQKAVVIVQSKEQTV
jgi:hypothetical protein